ncbi:hypothetical protein EON66_01505, partial [archaeon]
MTGSCDVYATTAEALRDKVMWLNFVVIIVSVMHSFLLLKAVVRSLMLMLRLKSWAKAQALLLKREAEAASAREGASGDGARQHSGGASHVAAQLGSLRFTREARVGDRQSVRLDFRSDIDMDG